MKIKIIELKSKHLKGQLGPSELRKIVLERIDDCKVALDYIHHKENISRSIVEKRV